MNREIMKIVNRVVSEEFSGRISNIKNRLFENKGSKMCESCGSGDMYEGECMECGNMYEDSEMCESCGGEMREGKMCESCGNTYEGNIQELGGMDDGHPRLGKKRLPNKMSIEDIETLLRGDDNADDDDDKNDYRDLSAHNPYYDDDVDIDDFDELGEEVCEDCEDTYEIELGEKLYGNQSRIDRNKNNRIDREDFEMLRKGDSEERELDEKLYGNQSRIDRNKNNRIDREDFEMLRKESKVYFTESEIIDIIENIVKEEKKKGKAPSAQNILKSTLGQSKKENEENIKRVAKKMKEYLKNGSKGDYEMDPTNFPEGNYDLDKRKESLKKYTPSEAVDEYIDAFSYPGMTNLVYDEIKPDDNKIEKYLKGHRTTGNAEFDEEGKPLGNVVPSKVGEKFKKNYDENLYGQEQMNASYKRYPQDTIEVAGDVTKKGSMKGKKTAQSVLNAVEESTEDKKVILEMGKIKNLIGYNRKTQ